MLNNDDDDGNDYDNDVMIMMMHETEWSIEAATDIQSVAWLTKPIQQWLGKLLSNHTTHFEEK